MVFFLGLQDCAKTTGCVYRKSGGRMGTGPRKNPLNFSPDPEKGQFEELLGCVTFLCYFMLFRDQL